MMYQAQSPPPNQTRFNWNNGKSVWIANFYEVREDKETAIVFEDPLGRRKTVYESDYKQYLDELADGGYEEVSKRKRKRRSIWKTIIGGSQILEEAVRIPGKLLPIIPMYGFRSYVDGTEFWYGLVRKNKDANRLLNMGVTSIAETSATSSKDMPIFSDEQVEGREAQLSEMHLGKYNYVVINQLYAEDGSLLPSGPQGVWQASRVDPNSAAVVQIAGEYIQSETGGAPIEVTDTQMSGKLFNAMSQRIDLNTFVLMDNIAKSLRRAGEVYRSIAGEVYDVDRVVNLIKENGEESTALLFELVTDEETGETKAINDITTGVYEVEVDTGPAFASRRRETLETMKEVLQITDPNSPYFAFLYSAIIENIDGVGLDGLKEFNSTQMLMTGMRQPENAEEAEQLAQSQANQTNEQKEYIAALANESNANAEESISQIAKNESTAQLNAAKTAETMNGIDISRFKAANEAINQAREQARAAFV